MYVQNPCGDSAPLDIWTDAITQFIQEIRLYLRSSVAVKIEIFMQLACFSFAHKTFFFSNI